MRIETAKSSHLNIRVTELSKNILKKAAKRSGESLSHFIMHRALASAQEILSEPEIINLSPQDQKLFLDLLENPPPLNHNLKTAIKIYKKALDEGKLRTSR
jgi:uncharacterized protein (DUF1778 family)